MSNTTTLPSTPILIKDLGLLFPTEDSKNKARYGVFKCSCGILFKTQIRYVKTGVTKSCGCYNKKRSIDTHTTHGGSYNSLYKTWDGIIQRCTNPKANGYESYGGRGITICNEWRNSFEHFYTCMYDTWSEGLSIDRIDPNGNYTPENCRWATKTIQARNTRLLKSTNTSGYRGVSWGKRANKWVACIKVASKNKHLGHFSTALEAAIAYDKYVLDNNLEHTTNGVV